MLRRPDLVQRELLNDVPERHPVIQPAGVRIYQAYYEDDQKSELDPTYIPLDNTANPYPDWAEYYLFQKHVADRRHAGNHYSAVLSWRFFRKTRLRGDRVIRFIKDHPGFDVYSFNFAPEIADSYRNIWLHGECHHPGLIAYAQRIFDDLGYKIRLKELRNTPRDLLFCNYWVGSERFWNLFMEFTGPVHEWLAHHQSECDRATQRASHAWASYRGKATYYPFIMERMFSTLLVARPEIRVCAFEYPEEYRLLVKEAHALEESWQARQEQTQSDVVWLATRLVGVPGVEATARGIRKLGRMVRGGSR